MANIRQILLDKLAGRKEHLQQLVGDHIANGGDPYEVELETKELVRVHNFIRDLSGARPFVCISGLLSLMDEMEDNDE